MFFSTPGAASNQYIFVKMVECEKLENGNFGVTRNKNIWTNLEVPARPPPKKTTCFFLFLRVSASQGHCSPKGRNGSRIFEPFVKLQCFFFKLLSGPLGTVTKKVPVSETGGGQIFPFLSTVLERASRGRPRECEEMCWLLGAASLNSCQRENALHWTHRVCMGVTVPLVPTAPYYLCNLSSSAWHHHCLHHLYFFRKIFDFGCKQSPRKASAPQENRWHYLICRQASISSLQKKPGRLSDSPTLLLRWQPSRNVHRIWGTSKEGNPVSLQLAQS